MIQEIASEHMTMKVIKTKKIPRRSDGFITFKHVRE